VYVAPAAQRRGIATKLLHALIAHARVRELHALIASLDAANSPSILLFERFGFREAARLPDVSRKFDEWRTQLLFIRAVDAE
jgi:phosphinothricin acetyltransferase